MDDAESVLDWEDNASNIPFFKHMIAGSMAGFLEHVAMFPVDTIKTHMQVDRRGSTSAFQLVRHFAVEEGITSLWTGAKALTIGCIPAHAAYFSVYEYFKKLFSIEANSNLYFFSTVMTGAAAVFCHDFFMTPAEVLKQRNQLLRQAGVLNTAREVVRTEGVIALYRSLPVNLLMNVPQAGIFMTVNENLKSVFLGQGPYTIPQVFTCAAIAECIASFITTPLDVLKTRMNTQTIAPKYLQDEMRQHKDAASGNEQGKVKYSNIISSAKSLLKEEGYKGFTRGASARITANVPSAAISWVTYEQIKKFII